MAKEKTSGFSSLIAGLLLVALGFAVGVPALIKWHRDRESSAVFHDIVRAGLDSRSI